MVRKSGLSAVPSTGSEGWKKKILCWKRSFLRFSNFFHTRIMSTTVKTANWRYVETGRIVLIDNSKLATIVEIIDQKRVCNLRRKCPFSQISRSQAHRRVLRAETNTTVLFPCPNPHSSSRYPRNRNPSTPLENPLPISTTPSRTLY